MTLRATGLKKSYNGITVVEDISMHVELGEIVGLLGPNGAGKTTCFYTIVGLVRADSGQVFINETELTDAAMHQRAAAGLGYLPQEASVFRTLTTEANLLAMLELNPKLDAAGRQAKMTSLLEEFSLQRGVFRTYILLITQITRTLFSYFENIQTTLHSLLNWIWITLQNLEKLSV